MKQNKYISKCGPYKVVSHSQGMDGIQIIIYPAFPEYDLKETDRDFKDACADCGRRKSFEAGFDACIEAMGNLK